MLCFTGDVSYAEEVKILQYTELERKTLVVETIRSSLTVHNYEPPYELILFDTKNKLRFDSPENAISSAISAVKYGWTQQLIDNFYGNNREPSRASEDHPWYDFDNVRWIFTRRVQMPRGYYISLEIRRRISGQMIGKTGFFVAEWSNGHWGMGKNYIDRHHKHYSQELPFRNNWQLDERPSHTSAFRNQIELDEAPVLPNPLSYDH